MHRRTFARTLTAAALSAAAWRHDSTRCAAETSLAKGRTAAVPYKLSVMLWTVFRDRPFEERLEKIAEAGYRAVELVGEYAKWSEDDFRRANRKRRELGISFDATAGLKHGVGDPRARRAFLDDLRKELKTVEKLEIPSLIVMSGNTVPGMAPEEQHTSCVEGLKRAAEIVEGSGTTLLLENIDLEENPRYYLWSTPEAFKVIEEVNHPQVKFLYDFYHAQISGGNLIAHLQRNIGRVGCVHIADVPGRHEPGTGEINYPNIYRKLVDLNFDRTVAMEFIPSGDPVESLRAARQEALRGGAPS
jgi:hydroxypyruvate isomerase